MSEYEYTVVELPIDDKLVQKVKELEDAGWKANPFKPPPTATYNLMREKQQSAPNPGAPSGLGKLQINDDLIMVLPAKGRVQ